VLPTLSFFLDRLNATRVIDICSGGSGPWLKLHRIIAKTSEGDFHVILTDRYPNLAAFRKAKELSGGIIDYQEEPVNAAAIPIELAGFRTLFTAFHHFPPSQARKILQNAVDCHQGIGVFEMTERSVSSILTMLLTPFTVLFITPRIRPFSLSRLLLTYLVPVVPLVVTFDGIVSCLRTYSLTELADMTSSLTGTPYDWEIRKVRTPGSPYPVIYAIGCPREPQAEESRSAE
jgi:hypothetical protein